MKYFLPFIVFFSFLHAQEELKSKKINFCVETNTFLNLTGHSKNGIKIFQGQNLLFDVGVNLNNKNEIGISIGCFHVQSKDKVAQIKYMKYTYFPLYCYYNKRLGHKNRFLGIKIGMPFLSYFDSEFVFDNNFSARQYWPNYSDTKEVKDNYVRSKPLIIISPYYSFQINKRINGIIGITSYVGNKLFFHINLGITYHL